LNVRKFDNDLAEMCKRVTLGQTPEIKAKLETVRLHLVDLYRKNLVKINHSIIELLCADKLISEGYEVNVERELKGNLVCDVYGSKGESTMLVEIETGFVPPSHALDPARYCYARIISKTARYSPFSNRFVLGTTVTNILPVPAIFQRPPRFRNPKEVQGAKTVCDIYYSNPPITIDQIAYANVHSIFILDVDHGSILETTPDVYLSQTVEQQKPFVWS
jgi:hypothetical protein